MPSIHTEIEIEAPVAEVWEVLTEWGAYPAWNPLVDSVVGELREGARLAVHLRLGRARLPIVTKLVALQPERELRWVGHALVPGIFDGEHSFAMEPLPQARTRFVHAERFSGVAAGLVLRLVGEQTRAGFEAMNRALKRRCETSLVSARTGRRTL